MALHEFEDYLDLRDPKVRPARAGRPARYAEAVEILETDPYNTSRRHAIRKLKGVHSECGLRREDTYK